MVDEIRKSGPDYSNVKIKDLNHLVVEVLDS